MDTRPPAGSIAVLVRYGSDLSDAEWAIRDASPTAAVLDSQSVKTTEAGGPRGYDAGKNTKGRKRHAMVDTDGRPLVIHAHSADIQDRAGQTRHRAAAQEFLSLAR